MPAELWTLQPSPSASSLGSADSTGRDVGAGVGLGVSGLGGGGGRVSDISNKPSTTSRGSPPGSSAGHHLSSSNSDTLFSSFGDESAIHSRVRGAMTVNVGQLAVASNPLLVGGGESGVGTSPSARTMVSSLTRASPTSSERQQHHQHHYYQQQQHQQQHQHQQSQQQYGLGYFGVSGRGAQSPGDYAGVVTGAGISSDSSSSRAAETIIHFSDLIPALQVISFTPPPFPPVEGSSSSPIAPNSSYAHNYPHPQHQHPSHNADTIALPSSPSAHHHPLPLVPTTTTAATPPHVDLSVEYSSSKFQAIRKRFSLGAMGLVEGGPDTAIGGDGIGKRTSLASNNNNKEPVRQRTKDSTKTLSSESTAALLKREDLKDDSSLVHNKLGGGRGMGLTMDEDGRTHSAASGAIQFQESDNAGMTRRGSTMTSSSDNTQSTYRLNVNIPRTGYYSEKDGFSHGHHGYDTNKSSPAHNLIIVSRTATTPTTPNTPHDSVFRQAGGNNSNSTPNGKRYIDTRKRNKQQRKEDKALAKASFNKRKTLFSNERTFIHWIKFGMLLGALAMTLLNFSGDEVARRGIDQTLANRVGKIGKNVGVTLLLVCLLSLLYAAVSYHWRHLGIVKDAGHRRYFDRVGPTFLTIALLATYTMNVVLTIQVSSLMDHNYEPSIYLNNNNNNPGSHAFPALTPPPQAATNEIESVTPSASPPPPSSALAHPKRPVFDTPFLPPGSTILVDSDEDDGSEFEFPDPPSDPDDPTVTTASSTTDPESGLRPSTEDSPTEPSSPSSSSTSSSESSSEKGSVPSNSVSRTGTDASSEYDWYTTMSGGSSSGDEDDNN